MNNIIKSVVLLRLKFNFRFALFTLEAQLALAHGLLVLVAAAALVQAVVAGRAAIKRLAKLAKEKVIANAAEISSRFFQQACQNEKHKNDNDN